MLTLYKQWFVIRQWIVGETEVGSSFPHAKRCRKHNKADPGHGNPATPLRDLTAVCAPPATSILPPRRTTIDAHCYCRQLGIAIVPCQRRHFDLAFFAQPPTLLPPPLHLPPPLPLTAARLIAMASDMTDSDLSSVPSSPLSELAHSPSPPPDMAPRRHPYPSPPASQDSRQTSSTNTPSPDGMDSATSTDKEGPPPAKRRRISKERSTKYLDLRSSDIDPEQQPELDRMLHVLHNRSKIVVIAGAGISVSAGSMSTAPLMPIHRSKLTRVTVPDFRSSTGLFRSLKDEHRLKGSGKHLFDAAVYKDDTSTSSFHDMVSSMSRLTKDAKPTAFHHMLATIAKEDRLLRLYSQNVDSIDTSLEPLRTRVPLQKDADGKWPRTVQLHGGLDKMVCSKCNTLSDFKADLFFGPVPPLCPRCEEINDIRTNHEGKRSHGIGRLRPRMVLYNEHNPDDVAIGDVTQFDLKKRPDAVIVAGTTLKVPGVRRIVREMCGVVRDRRGGVAIWVNNDLPPVAKDLEDCFDIVVQGPCDEVASRAAMPRWDEPSDEDTYTEVNDEDAKKAAANPAMVSIPDCSIPHADRVPLPSPEFLNNTFPPPPSSCGTPRIERSSPDFSPMPSRTSSILPSIETETDTIEVRSTGLLTPTKSHKSSPAKPTPPIKLKLKNSTKPKQTALGAAKTTNPPKKKSNVKYVKPAKSAKAKTGLQASKGKPGPKANVLSNSFKTSKTAALQVSKTVTKMSSSPSKLRQVSNASSEPMHPVSPRDPRNNTSPSKTSPSKRAFFPGLASENAMESLKKQLFA
jgi:NAD+-dependent protein deacetylase SIR2